CDILLKSDFLSAVQSVTRSFQSFLMAGRRWDVDITTPLDFAKTDWEKDVHQLAVKTNQQKPPKWIDYFVFRKELFYKQIPEFVIGRPGWDNWLIWHPLSVGVPVIDVSARVVAVHQNHDYGYHPQGEIGVWQGEEAQENYKLHAG